MELYDEVPYPPLTHSHTHPDRLAVVGRLMGLQPARPEACRVLEIGCGGGANLIAMAELLPSSEFVGIDISKPQVADGERVVAQLGFENVKLQYADILDLPDDFGPFDYIIAHGFYSWVPDHVREKALRLIRDSLTPHGIAHISYNALPGWQLVGAMRDMMLYRTREIGDPDQRAEAAREFIAFLAESQPAVSPYTAFVHQYASSFHNRGPVPLAYLNSSLLHDELSSFNQAFYFWQVVEAAQAAGLEFLAEADLEGSTPAGLNADVVQKLSSLARSTVEMEQYLDFLRGRGFRKTLFCRDDAPISRSLRVNRATMAGFQVSSAVRPRRPRGSQEVTFTASDGNTVTTGSPLLQAALRHLRRVYPRSVPFEELLARATGSARPSDAEGDTLAGALLSNFARSRLLVELYLEPRPLVTRVGRRPQTLRYARFVAEGGDEIVASARHERVQLDALGRILLPLLDGEHDRGSLLASARQANPAARQGDVDVELKWLGRSGLLIA